MSLPTMDLLTISFIDLPAVGLVDQFAIDLEGISDVNREDLQAVVLL